MFHSKQWDQVCQDIFKLHLFSVQLMCCIHPVVAGCTGLDVIVCTVSHIQTQELLYCMNKVFFTCYIPF